MNFNDAWNNRPVPDRVKLSVEAGLGGRIGSKDWEDIEPGHQQQLTETIISLWQRRHADQERFEQTLKELGCSREYLQSCPIWIQQGRKATAQEFTKWVHSQSDKVCRYYKAAWPVSHYRGKCIHYVQNRKPCTAIFAHTGVCETGFFNPDGIKQIRWSDFQKTIRCANRKAREVVG